MSDKRRTIFVRPEACVFLALTVLMIPLRWVIAWGVAVAAHELAHYFCIYICGSRVISCTVGLNGVTMEIMPMEPLGECLCAAAGPAGSLMLLAIRRWCPLVAFFGVVQACFNLLPIYPLDGGRVLKLLLTMAGFPAAVFVWIQRTVLGILFTGIVYLQFNMRMGMLAIMVMAVLLIKIFNKNLANSSANGYNSCTN